jgi:hypothetical protein
MLLHRITFPGSPALGVHCVIAKRRCAVQDEHTQIRVSGLHVGRARCPSVLVECWAQPMQIVSFCNRPGLRQELLGTDTSERSTTPT